MIKRKDAIKMSKNRLSFAKWLHQPQPKWKKNLEVCNDYLFYEIKMNRAELTKLMEKLEEYEIFKGYDN